MNGKGSNLYKIILYIVIAAIVIGLFIYFTHQDQDNPNKNNEDWQQPVDKTPDYSFGKLYNLTNVIELDDIFKNPTFLKQVKDNHLIYLYGYSAEGRNIALICYDERFKGYKIIIYDNILLNNMFSIFIPESDSMFKSDEFLKAKDLLKNDYKITIPVNKLRWQNNIEYSVDDESWRLSEKSVLNNSYLSISNSDNDIWEILLEGDFNKPAYIELFSYKKNPKILTFVFYYGKTDKIINKFQIYTIDLATLNKHNSNVGKNTEANNWIYGNYEFIYNQWNTVNRKGFLAVSISDRSNSEELDFDKIEQWVYINPTGLMQLHANYEGIYNREGNLLTKTENGVYYRINIIEEDNGLGSTYFVIDLYDAINGKFLKTIEFNWDEIINGLSPLNVDLFEEEK